MLDFDLTEEQRLLEQTVREWARREVAPRIKELDRAHAFDPKILPQMADLGLLGISVPVEYGGAGMDYIALGLASEELEYVDTSLRVIMSVHAGLNCLSLLTWGTEDQKQRYLIPQAQGKKIATYGLTEPAAGSDVRGIQTVAVKRGDRYFLTGEKMWISLADVADNFLVFAWSDQEKKKARDTSGITAFIVERAFKGFSSGTLKEKWGILAGNTGYFKMDDMEVPEENVLGRPGEGFKIAMFALDQGRYTVAAGATGLIRACRDASSKYALERRTFGQAIARTSARQADDREDGVRLSGVAAPLAARRVSQERRAPQYPRNRSGEMVFNRRLRAGGRRCRAGTRCKRLFGRISGGPLLSQLQRCGHLRGHARGPHVDAGRLRAGLPAGSADSLRAPAHAGHDRRRVDGRRPLARIPPRRGAGSHRLRADDGARRQS